MPVPPLQWLNITNLLQGTSVPPLKYPSIGYDDGSRTLLIFGGESSSGIPTSQTFLLNFDTNTWALPNPQADLPTNAPPARYMAVSGDDFSSSYRHAHLLLGGKDINGKPLSDVWEFDYINQFWSRVTVTPPVPLPRWSASGGRDYRTAPDSTSTNNTFYMSGGTNGQSTFPINQVWQLKVSGTLSSNLAANNTFGSWSNQTLGNVPGSSVNQASAVLGTSIVSISGCNTTADSSDLCADSNSYVVNAGSSSEITPPPCPVPRYGGALVFNPSSASSSFASQVFLILGTFNSSYWDDQGGLRRGEVAVLDADTGAWTRILPAGDPGTSGIPTFPTPREGAVAYSFSEALVGSNRNGAADTIVFGGQDENGTYLNEVWILRAYNGVVTASNSSWGGPNGQLETGINANGAGVTIQYMTQCASQLKSVPTTTSPSSTSIATSTSMATSTATPKSFLYDVSFVHKLTAPLSMALLLPAILLARLAPAKVMRPTGGKGPLVYLAWVIAILAYGLGLTGLVTSFTFGRPMVVVRKRSASGSILKTGHGIAGLILAIALYGVVPSLYFLLFFRSAPRRPQKEVIDRSEAAASRANSVDTAEKLASSATPQQTQYPPSPPASPRTRLHSWGGSSFWLGRRSREGRVSTDSESMHSAGPQRAFEVVNRPARIRRASINGLAYPNIEIYQRVPVVPRSLGDVDWLDRRRSLNAVNELDYIVNHGRTQGLPSGSTPNTADMLSTRALVPAPPFPRVTYELPSPFELSIRIFSHMLVFALCSLSLVALWYHAPMSLFAVFLLWTAIFYISLFALAWHGRPRKSLLTTLVARVRGPPPQPAPSPGTPTSRPLSIGTDQYPFPTDTRGPYLHQPLYRATGHDDVSTSQGPRSVDTDDDDDDIDEDTRQRRIEEEMGRREVSIVTVPKRRLWITNPS
ncbi:hypothetical protein L210DRAFT_3521072 [Boletus edulis BED1]|uniref:Uncharacterized protein n=1 Tax=Boletus edulis BED1 TaxID=1328754 RepID=A0AAD4C872_BOLED|nr:hypothetical protein L210DRAFT_3521072 [Boletus edulis BED1]